MSRMELRSSRSRSKTPFISQDLIDKELSVKANDVEKTVVRSTRRTTVIKSNESASSSTDEVNTSRETSSSTSKPRKSSSKSLRSRIFKTSDYSSEDGENEVSSSRTVRQNERNQLVEDARTLVNGADMPALELYKKSGRYWDVYPKTDWTYSYHSKDRVEIAPGVVAMPNMSRKAIHSLDESSRSHSSFESSNLYSENVSHKNINTDNTFTARYSSSLGDEFNKRSTYNHNTENNFIKRRTHTRWSSFKETVTTIFTSIFTTIYTLLHVTYRVQTSIFSQIHRVASKVMLWDTYLLWKSRSGDRATKLAMLCLVPLLLLGGFWLLSSAGSVLYGAVFNNTSTWSLWSQSQTQSPQHFDYIQRLPNIEAAENKFQPSLEDKIKIAEKVYIEPPSASEIAGSFTKEQIDAIAMAVKNSLNLEGQKNEDKTEELVENIINNPSFYKVINNHYQNFERSRVGISDNENIPVDLLNKHQTLIDSLLKEIENMKQEIHLNSKLTRDNYAKLSLDMKKCCEKRPIINIEGYVSRVLTDLLNNPEFLHNQKGLNSWLHSLFVAKQDLEHHLGNITANMEAKMAALVQSNSQLLMDTVAARLREFNKETVDVKKVVTIKEDISEHKLTDEGFVKKIVKEALAIYDADRTGLVDYAMENMGGQVVTTRCTEPYHYGKAVVSVLGVPLWHVSNSPRTVITPTIAPGDCWAFQNFPGFVVVKLSSKVKIDAFSMEHISKLLIPDGKMDSAPKEFEVYGLKEENDRDPVLLGTYKFDYDGDSLQFFLVQQDNQVFDMIEVRIISNHGNPNYTCLYRFRVHGKLHHEDDR